MPAIRHQYPRQRFFSDSGIPSTGEKRAGPAFVDVGGYGDCGFRSVAAGIIDGFLHHPRAYADLLSKVLAHHVGYFPAHRTTLPGLTTPTDRMQQLIKTIRMSELVPAMAYTLRQMAVTEMLASPSRYRGAFVQRHEGTTPDEMRKAGTWIDESSIAALAHVLDLPIEVHVVGRGKTLPMRLRYNDLGAAQAPVVMRLQDGHYTPRVHNKDRFEARISQRTHAVLPAEIKAPADRPLSEIYAEIAAEDKRLVDAFESAYDRLAVMVAAGELSKDDLLAMYIKGMATSDYLSGRVAHVCAEHGSQQFFDEIIQAQRGEQSSVLSAPGDDTVNELVHALARAMTIGQMSEENVFAHVDTSIPLPLKQNF